MAPKKSFSEGLQDDVINKATRTMLEAAREPAPDQRETEPKAQPKEAPTRRRKETLSVRLNLLTTPSIKERLEALSADTYESINALVNKAIIEALEKEGY